MNYIIPITVDLSGKYFSCLQAVQGDTKSRFIFVSIKDFVIPEGTTARVAFCKPSKKQVFNDAEIIENTVKFELTQQMLAEYGEGLAEIKLYQGNSLLTTAKIKVKIHKCILNKNQIESSCEYDSLTRALQKVDGLEDEIAQAVKEANEAADRAEQAAGSAGGFKAGAGLIMKGDVLSVDTANAVEEDNTKPVTSAAVFTQLGNVEALLASI